MNANYDIKDIRNSAYGNTEKSVSLAKLFLVKKVIDHFYPLAEVVDSQRWCGIEVRRKYLAPFQRFFDAKPETNPAL